MLQLVVERDGVVVGPPIELAPGRLLIGASPDAAVRLPAADAAERHAWLVHGDGAPPTLEAGAVLEVGDAPLAAGATIALVLPTAVRIGACVLRLAPSNASSASSPVRTASLARELVRQLMVAQAHAPVAVELHLERGPGLGERRALPLGRTTLGRGDEATWSLLDPDLSRQHAVVERTWDGVTVADLGSKNGTLVDGTPVDTTPRALAVGGTIELGQTLLRLVDPAELALRATRPRAAAAAPPPTVAIVVPVPAARGRAAFWLAVLVAAIATAALLYVLL